MIAFTVTINATSFQAALALGDALVWTWFFIFASRVDYRPYSAPNHSYAYAFAAGLCGIVGILTGVALGASVVS